MTRRTKAQIEKDLAPVMLTNASGHPLAVGGLLLPPGGLIEMAKIGAHEAKRVARAIEIGVLTRGTD